MAFMGVINSIHISLNYSGFSKVLIRLNIYIPVVSNAYKPRRLKSQVGQYKIGETVDV